MFLPLYILSLGLSAGLVGVTGRRFLASAGFVPDFRTGLLVAVGIACVYLCVELAYVALLRLLKPTRSFSPLFFEMCSHAAALFLILLLLDIDIPFVPEKSLPSFLRDFLDFNDFICLAFFGATHVAIKLITLFAATQAPESGRLGALGWIAACLLGAFGVSYTVTEWQVALNQNRFVPLEESQSYCVGDTFSTARPLGEGAFYTLDLSGKAQHHLTLRWANEPETEEPLQEAYITLTIQSGHRRSSTVLPLSLDSNGWTELHIPDELLDEDVSACTLMWTAQQEAQWVTMTGLRPAATSQHKLLFSGPWAHAKRQQDTPPNIILIAVEGLAAERVHALGGERETTPLLDKLAEQAITYSNAFVPAPEVAASCMTLLTGVSPLTHGYLGKYQGILPPHIHTLAQALQQKNYVTMAFTEGDSPLQNDLFYGSGFERGFELFNTVYPVQTRKQTVPGKISQPIPQGVQVTLDKAEQWIENHSSTPFFLFLRLRELEHPMRLARYGEGFLGQGRTPTPLDIYDTALANVDQQLGAFLEKLQSLPVMRHTCLVLTSTNGFDFTEPGRVSWRRGGKAKRSLMEGALRVPLFILAPNQLPRKRITPIRLEDVAPTVLALTGATVPQPLSDIHLLDTIPLRDSVSMQGEPLALSLRTKSWRYTWQSGLSPFTREHLAGEEPLQFLNMDRYRLKLKRRDNFSEHPSLAEKLQQRLRVYLEEQPVSAAQPLP